MIKDLLLDFDGVVLESIDCKIEAFAKLYESFGDSIQQKVIEHHSMNGGMSRFEKIRLYHAQFLGINLSEQEIKEWSEKFASMVIEEVIRSDFVPGMYKFLENYSNKMNLWVITATPQAEIEYICEKLNITRHFKGIFGSPQKKTFWLNKLLAENSIERATSTFIGDSPNDLEAANSSGISFILRETDQNLSFFSDFRGQRIKDFTNFDPSNVKKSVS